MTIPSRNELQAQLADYLVELFEVPRNLITADALLYEDLDLDSIDAVDLVVQLQHMTGRRIQPEAFKSVRTVKDVVDCVEQLLAADAPVDS
jgi:acyl carrier protein